jgi:SH3-like domain-containing protein
VKSPAHDTALFLSALPEFGSFAGSQPWAVYVDREPLEPSDVVTVYNTGGLPDAIINDVEEPSIQVRVRSADGNGAWQKAMAAVSALQSALSVPVEGGQVVQWVALGGPLQIGRDDADRALFTVNFRMMRELFRPGNPWASQFSAEFG